VWIDVSGGERQFTCFIGSFIESIHRNLEFEYFEGEEAVELAALEVMPELAESG
jgi:hypothetical protein